MREPEMGKAHRIERPLRRRPVTGVELGGGGADCGAAGAQTFPTTSAAAAIVKTRGQRLSSCRTGGWVGGGC